eukprot:gene13020-14360_t
MESQYHLDITDISGETVGKDLKAAIDKLSVDVEAAKSKAANERQDIEQLLNDYTTQQADYEKRMELIEQEIRTKEQNIDAAVLDISTDCVLKCKTGKLSSSTFLLLWSHSYLLLHLVWYSCNFQF